MDKQPVIKSLTLKGFRSIAAERIELDNPTFLVGRNGAGKSNLVAALAFLAEAMESPLTTVVGNYGGIGSICHRTSNRPHLSQMGMALDFEIPGEEPQRGSYGFQIRALPNYGFEVARERCTLASGQVYFDHSEQGEHSSFAISERGVMPGLSATSLALPVLGGVKQFSPVFRLLRAMRPYAIEPAKLREWQDPDNGDSLQWDGRNAASVLQKLSRDSEGLRERIGDLLGAVVPHNISVRSVQYGSKLTLQLTQMWGEGKEITFDAASMSDGTLRALGLLIAAFQQPPPSLMIIEEPEASIHPGALGLISDLVQVASDRTQVIVTTHSPELLDMKWIKDRHLRLVSWENGATRVSRISEGTRRVLQEHLAGVGEMLRSNSLDSAPLPEMDADQMELFRKAG